MDNHCRKRNVWIAVILALTFFFLSFLLVDNGHDWGDDFAGYLLQASALRHGTVIEQGRRNLTLHPSEFFSGVLEEMPSLYYVWGLPMAEALIDLLFGNGDLLLDVYLTKILMCVLLGLFTGVSFLFYRRRFSTGLSVVLVAMLSTSLLRETDGITTDLPFLVFSMLSFWLFEVWEEKKFLPAVGVAAGLSMWYLNALRLNGLAILGWLALTQVIKAFPFKKLTKRDVLRLVPWGVFAVALGIQSLCLPTPTSNVSDVGMGNLFEGVCYYADVLGIWGKTMLDYRLAPLHTVACFAMLALGVTGFLMGGWKREWVYTVYFLFTILVAAMLPYYQGLRYLLNILPYPVLFIGWGVTVVWEKLQKKDYKYTKICTTVLCILVCVGILENVVSTTRSVQQRQEYRRENSSMNAFAPDCMDIYSVLSDRTSPDAVIAYRKPRILCLATGRMAFNPLLEQHSIQDADYYLRHVEQLYEEPDLTPEDLAGLAAVYENESFILYRVIK